MFRDLERNVFVGLGAIEVEKLANRSMEFSECKTG